MVLRQCIEGLRGDDTGVFRLEIIIWFEGYLCRCDNSKLGVSSASFDLN